MTTKSWKNKTEALWKTGTQQHQGYSALLKEWDQTKEGRQSGLWEQERSVGLISLLSSPSAQYTLHHSRKLTKASQRHYIQTHFVVSQGSIDSSTYTHVHHTETSYKCAIIQQAYSGPHTHKVIYIWSCMLEKQKGNTTAGIRKAYTIQKKQKKNKASTSGSVW